MTINNEVETSKEGKILIVEPEKNSRNKLQWLLQDTYNVSSVENTKQALGYLQSCEVDLVITDLDVPNSESQIFLDTIKDRKNQIPTIIWTENPKGDVIKPYLKSRNFSSLVKSGGTNNILHRVKNSIWPKICRASYSEVPQVLLIDEHKTRQAEEISDIVRDLGYSLNFSCKESQVFRSFHNYQNGVVFLNDAFPGSRDIVTKLKETYPFTKIIGYSEGSSESSESLDFLSDTYPELISDFLVGDEITGELEEVLLDQVRARQDDLTDRLRARPPRVYLVAGARGSGKSLLRNGAYFSMPLIFPFPSDTTGKKRLFENERDHNFIDSAKFFDKIEDYFMVYYYEREEKECIYGHDRNLLNASLSEGRDVVLSITNPKIFEPFLLAYNEMKSQWGLLSDLTTIMVSTPEEDLKNRLEKNRVEKESMDVILEGHREFEKMRDDFDFVIENPGNYERPFYNQMTAKELNVVNRLVREFCGYVWSRRYDEKSPF